MSSRWLDTSLAYLKGIGPLRAEALASELGLRTFGDLVAHYPYRYVDRSVVLRIREVQPGPAEVQVRGLLTGVQTAFDIPDEPLKRPDMPVGPVVRYLTAARLFREAHPHVHALTDVTGFSLIGHAHEMAHLSKIALRFALDELPLAMGHHWVLTI